LDDCGREWSPESGPKEIDYCSYAASGVCWVYVMVFLVDEMTTLSQALWSRSHPTVGQLTSQIFVEELTLLFLISVVSVSFVCLSLRYGLAFAVSLAYSTGLSLV
jgi:hypothetical protein